MRWLNVGLPVLISAVPRFDSGNSWKTPTVNPKRLEQDDSEGRGDHNYLLTGCTTVLETFFCLSECSPQYLASNSTHDERRPIKVRLSQVTCSETSEKEGYCIS
jgi:hypothetical protein